MSTVYPKYKAWKANGVSPAVGYYLYTYESGGTTIPKATYSDAELQHAHTNPIVLDSNGEADIFLGPGSYRFDLKTPLGALINTFDPVTDSIPSTDLFPKWIVSTLTFAQLAAANMDNQSNYVAYSLPMKGVIHAVKARITTPFSGGAISAYNIALGISGLPEELTAYYDVFTPPSYNSAQLTQVLATYDQLYGATSIYANATCAGANLDQATAGELEIAFLVSVPGQ